MNPLVDPTGKYTHPKWVPIKLVMELEQKDDEGKEIIPFTQVTYRQVQIQVKEINNDN